MARKVVLHDSKSDLPLEDFQTNHTSPRTKGALHTKILELGYMYGFFLFVIFTFCTKPTGQCRF